MRGVELAVLDCSNVESREEEITIMIMIHLRILKICFVQSEDPYLISSFLPPAVTFR